MSQNPFPYSYWTKFLGVVIIGAAVITFLLGYCKKGIFDLNELAIGCSWGFVFIFFSKEKTDDEMIQGLKFKALSRAIIISFSVAHLYNYIFTNWQSKHERDIISSVSAYEFLATTLIIAIVGFYYMKHQATLNEEE